MSRLSIGDDQGRFQGLGDSETERAEYPIRLLRPQCKIAAWHCCPCIVTVDPEVGVSARSQLTLLTWTLSLSLSLVTGARPGKILVLDDTY